MSGLLIFFWDNKAISFSIFYIFADIVLLKFLRNIERDISIEYILISFVVLIALLACAIRLRNIPVISDGRKTVQKWCRRFLLFSIIFFSACIVGTIAHIRVRAVITSEETIEKSITSFTQGSVEFTGTIASETSSKHTYDFVYVKLNEDLKQGDNILPQEGQSILVKIKKDQTLKIGEVCDFSGTLKIPENYSDFKYQDYLKNNEIYLIMEFPQLNCDYPRKGIWIRNILSDFKQKLDEIIEQNLKEPQSSLLMGIMFGEDRLFSKTFDENIRIAGVSHIVAASGYNITILLLAGKQLLRYIPFKLRILLLVLIIWAFCIFSGLSPSILRACIMTTISLCAILLGRQNSIHTALPLASAIFVLVEPKIVYDVGFQLSVFATAGLIYLQPSLSVLSEKIFKKKIPFLENTLFTTLSCTLVTIPLTITTFKTLSVWSVIANMLILPVVETTLLIGVIALLTSSLSVLISKICFEMIYIQLKYFQLVVDMIGSVGWGAWSFETIPIFIPIIFSAVLILFCIYFYPVGDESHNYYLKIFD